MNNKIEKCIQCDQPTDRAGIHEDSLYLDNGEGPLCLDCYQESHILELETERDALRARVKDLEEHVAEIHAKMDRIMKIANGNNFGSVEGLVKVREIIREPEPPEEQ